MNLDTGGSKGGGCHNYYWQFAFSSWKNLTPTSSSTSDSLRPPEHFTITREDFCWFDNHLVFLLRYSLLIGTAAKGSAHLGTENIFFRNFFRDLHLLHLPPHPEKVEASELLEVEKSPVAGSVEGGEEIGILGHILQSLGNPSRFETYKRALVKRLLTHWCRRNWLRYPRSRFLQPPSRGWYVLQDKYWKAPSKIGDGLPITSVIDETFEQVMK